MDRRPADLEVRSISSKAYSHHCRNTFEFEICNNGNFPISRDFVIRMTANGQSAEYLYEASENPLGGQECRTLQLSDFRIWVFGIGLGVTKEVTVEADPGENLNDVDPSNNTSGHKKTPASIPTLYLNCTAIQTTPRGKPRTSSVTPEKPARTAPATKQAHSLNGGRTKTR